MLKYVQELDKNSGNNVCLAVADYMCGDKILSEKTLLHQGGLMAAVKAHIYRLFLKRKF